MSSATIGRYQIRSELGRGGMATVYHAVDPRFGREVAIKVLPREFLHDPKFRARFEREARAIAALQHPAIVPVHDFGEENGQPYLVMRYMPGGSLAERLHHGPLPLPEAARILSHLAPALDVAHQRGLIHRDLKPGNILFDEFDNPYLSDFGIVKITEETAQLTGTGGLVGTPAYMSPEQAGGGRVVGYRSDLYALGVIAFEMLTGQVPYQADTPIQQAVKHLTEPVPDILRLRPDLPPGCDAFIRQAMAKEPEQRFGSAGELVAALSEIAAGGMRYHAPAPVIPPTEYIPVDPAPPYTPTFDGTPPPPMQRPERSPRKRPLGVVWLGAGLVVILAGVIGGAIILASLLPLNRSPGTADAGDAAETPESTDAPVDVPTQIPTPKPTVAASIETPPPTTPTVPLSGNDLNATATIDALRTQAAQALTATWQAGSGTAVAISATNVGQVAALESLDQGASDLEWSPDGTVLAIAFAADGQGVSLWNGQSDEPPFVLDAIPTTTLAWSPDGTQLVCGSKEKHLRVWNILNQTSRTFTYFAFDVDWSPGGKWIAVATGSNLILFDPRSAAAMIDGFNARMVAFHPGGEQLLAAYNFIVEVYTVEPLDQVGDDRYISSISDVIWSPDGAAVAEMASFTGGKVTVWDSDWKWPPILEIEGASYPTALAWSPTGALIAVGRRDGTIDLIDALTGALLRTLPASTEARVSALDWSPDGARLAAAVGGQTTIWGLAP